MFIPKNFYTENRFLVTGGAGFIGSNIVQHLIKNNAKEIVVIDDLSTGSVENIKMFFNNPNFKFIEGSILDKKLIKLTLKGIQYVSHQAALGSVPRSIIDPVLSQMVNVQGFLNVLDEIRYSKTVKGFVYASSSSIYGNVQSKYKVEGNEGELQSPYAFTKYSNEVYAKFYWKNYSISSIGLRYFNVFGPNQQINNPYAAVIPIFISKMIKSERPLVNGSLSINRDFTYVDNVVNANILSLLNSPFTDSYYLNIGCGKSYTLGELIDSINLLNKSKIAPIIGPKRKGDVSSSLANTRLANFTIGYDPQILFKEGLALTYEHIKKLSK